MPALSARARRAPAGAGAAAQPPTAAARATPVGAPRAGPPAAPVVVDSLTPSLFAPTPARPLRAKMRHLSASTRVLPHQHPWAQLALSTAGVVRLAVPSGTFIVPPSRALWIPPGVEHTVTMVDDAVLHTLYLYQPRGRSGPGMPRAEEAAWRQCRVLEVSGLLRALVHALPHGPNDDPALDAAALQHERHATALVLAELRRARPVPLGIDLPRDKRLRTLCEAVLAEPTRHATLQAWAADTGASPRTVARLFRHELGTTFTQWRLQVVLAHAVALAAERQPVGQIAAELGYSASAFSAMVRRQLGQPARAFLAMPSADTAEN